MNDLLLKFFNFIQNIGITLTTLGKILFLSKRNRLNRTVNRKEKILVILGNGPSLNTSLTYFNNEENRVDVLGLNNFATTKYFEKIKPSYYVLLDEKFYPLEKHEYDQYYIDLINSTFEALEAKLTWEMILFVPFKAKKSAYFQNCLKRNKYIKASYYNVTPIEGFPFIKHLFFNNRLGLPRPHNVLIPSLMIGIWEGYSEIAIVGADHSWLGEIHVTKENVALVNQKHFYDEKKSKPQLMKNYAMQQRKLHEILYGFYLSFRSYWDIKKYAESKKVKIYNCSEVSFIDAFERKELIEILK